MKRVDLRDSTIVLLAVLQMVVILATHGEHTLEDVCMIESADAEQIITVRDNRGNFAELVAWHDVDGTIVLSINATDGVVQSTIALALVNFAAGLVTDNETGRYLDYARQRLLDTTAALLAMTQNGSPTRSDELPF